MEKLNYIGFGHAAMFVPKMDKAKEFYMDILDFKVVSEYVREDGTILCFLNNGNCTVELIEFADISKSKDRKDGVIDHLSILVEDIETAKAFLESKGVIFENEIQLDERLYQNGERYAHFRGPSGERLQIEQIL